MKEPADIDALMIRVMAATFGVPPDAINDSASVRTIPTWKGLNHLKMAQALEHECGIKFEPGEIETLINYKVIKATLKAYLEG